jgi:hypothetical protein
MLYKIRAWLTRLLDEHAVKQFGNNVTWYIPLGLREWFLKRGVDNVIELDWWQEIHHKGRPDILIACVPAMVSKQIVHNWLLYNNNALAARELFIYF